MLSNIANLATIAAFVVYIFIEWPKLISRWRESRLRPTRDKLLLALANIMAISTIVPTFLGMTAQGLQQAYYISIFLALMGSALVIGYWVDNRTLAYNRSKANDSCFWLLMMAAFGLGICGLLMFAFHLV